MNKLKNKNTYLFSLLISVLLFSIVIPTTVKAELKVGDLPLLGLTMSIEGERDGVAASCLRSAYKLNIALQADNTTVDDIPLDLESFADNDLSSELFQTDGITRTFSNSYAALITGVSSATGMYQTLRTIPESSFSQYALLKDSSIYSYAPLEPFAKIVNDSINAAYPTLTYLNVSVDFMYLTFVFDRAIIDDFFTRVKASSMFDEVSEKYSTNDPLITSMLDPIFASTGLLDFVYAPTNVSTYDEDWSIAKENRAVLGLNASDSSFDNATKTASLRNLLIGYIGWQIAPTTTTGDTTSKVENPNDVLFGFESTATTYSLKMNIKSDFTASPQLAWDMSMILNCFGLAEDVGPAIKQTILWFVVIGSAVVAGLAVVVLCMLFIKDKEKRKQYAILLGLLVAFATGVIVFLATTTSTIV